MNGPAASDGEHLADPNPRVTVVIAAFNAAPFISKAIASAQEQSERSLEIIVVDDASTDDTAKVVEAIARSDTRVSLLRSAHNRGPSAARNRGLAAAQGEWVMILDADDALLPSRCAAVIAIGEAHRSDVVVDNFCMVRDAGRRVSEPVLPGGFDVKSVSLLDYLRQARPFGDQVDWGLLKPTFRRQFLCAHALRYDEAVRYGEDLALAIDTLVAGARWSMSDAAGYLYTTRESGRSRTNPDTGALIEQTRQFRRLPGIADNPAALALLDKRMAALDRLGRFRAVQASCKARDPIRLAALLMHWPAGVAFLPGLVRSELRILVDRCASILAPLGRFRRHRSVRTN